MNYCGNGQPRRREEPVMLDLPDNEEYTRDGCALKCIDMIQRFGV